MQVGSPPPDISFFFQRAQQNETKSSMMHLRSIAVARLQVRGKLPAATGPYCYYPPHNSPKQPRAKSLIRALMLRSTSGLVEARQSSTWLWPVQIAPYSPANIEPAGTKSEDTSLPLLFRTSIRSDGSLRPSSNLLMPL